MDNIKLQSPDARGFDYASNNDGERKYKLRTGFDAKLNKLAGLYVEREEKARKRINNSVIEDSYCIEPGLNGIRKGISYIKSLYKDERDNLPRYLRKINLKLCESDVVAAIGCFHFRLDNIKLQSPDARGFDYASNNDGERKYKLRTGFDAKLNKLAGLYVEREEKARKRINNSVIEDSYCIEPGLNGIRKGISYIKSLYKDERDNLPRYLRKINLKYFKFSIGIIWDMDKDRNMLEDGSFEFISYDRDSISGTCGPSGCCFNFYNHDGWDYYLYNKPYFI
ncbi:unnamed protein product, partial [marine sediment metagenome]